MSEKRPIDYLDESVGLSAEAAELAEHIKETEPRWRREELLDQLITMIDDSHEQAANALVRFENNE